MTGTQVDVDAAARTLTVTRVFDAPRDVVWKAWTDPEEYTCWAGCEGRSVPLSTIVMDVRPGGEFRYTMVNDTTGAEMRSRATYREVVPPERLVWVYEDLDPVADQVVTTLTLTDLGDDRTELCLQQKGFGHEPTEQWLTDTHAGYGEEIDKLAAYVRSLRRVRA